MSEDLPDTKLAKDNNGSKDQDDDGSSTGQKQPQSERDLSQEPNNEGSLSK